MLQQSYFFIYFLGYIAINIILLIAIIGSIVVYGTLCGPNTYNSYFGGLQNKLVKDYTSITDGDLSDIDGFMVKINNENKVLYMRGHVIEEFKNINLQSYMYLFGLTKDNEESLNDDIRTMFALSDFNNSIIETKDNVKYSLYSKYLKEEDSLVVVGFPYSEITKPNRITKVIPHNLIIKIMGAFNVLLILSIVYILAKATSSAFIKPIKTLLAGVIEISHGNYNIRLDIDKKNEFLELANGFNMMAGTIQNEKSQKENYRR